MRKRRPGILSSSIGCTVPSFPGIVGRAAREQGKRLAAGCQDRAWHGTVGLHLRLRSQLGKRYGRATFRSVSGFETPLRS